MPCVCVCVCVCVCRSLSLSLSLSLCLFVSVSVYVYVHVSVCLCLCLSVSVSVSCAPVSCASCLCLLCLCLLCVCLFVCSTWSSTAAGISPVYLACLPACVPYRACLRAVPYRAVPCRAVPCRACAPANLRACQQNHSGGLGGGHYTAYGRNFRDNTWYNFNDSHVSTVDPSRVVSSMAYVLFYRRIAARAAGAAGAAGAAAPAGAAPA